MLVSRIIFFIENEGLNNDKDQRKDFDVEKPKRLPQYQKWKDRFKGEISKDSALVVTTSTSAWKSGQLTGN